MTPQYVLYHQIHALTLPGGWGRRALSVYPLWRQRMQAGPLVQRVPAAGVSTAPMHGSFLAPRWHSPFGDHIERSSTSTLWSCGHVAALPRALLVGLVIILRRWLRGYPVPRRVG